MLDNLKKLAQEAGAETSTNWTKFHLPEHLAAFAELVRQDDRERAAQDAKRYRWLRGTCVSQDEDEVDRIVAALNAVNPNPKAADEFDAAIDAAILATTGSSHG